MSDPIFYIVELELPDRDLRGFLDWYASVHAPHLYEAGFTLCTSYRALSGGMSVVDIYQAPDWSIFESDAFERYRTIAADDPHRPAYIGRNRNTRTPYHHVPWSKPDDPDIARPLVADWLTLWRFPADEALLARTADWLSASGAARLAEGGAERIRLLSRGREAPTGSSIRPGGALVVQWTGQPSASATDPDGLPGWLAAPIAGTEPFTGCRLYPWPNDPAARALAP